MELWRELLQEPPVEPHPRTDWISLARIWGCFYVKGMGFKARIQFRYCPYRETWFAEPVPAHARRLTAEERIKRWN